MRILALSPRTLFSAAMFPVLLTGCGSNKSDVPRSVTVELPDGSEVQATLGSGVITLADSEWELFATSATAQASPFMRLEFNADGALRRFADNTIAREIFGSSIRFDGKRRPTQQFGLEYTAATYGAETADGSGFAFEGRLVAFAAGLVEAATAKASATASFDPDDPTIIRGVFTHSIHVKISGIPTPPSQGPINFIGYLVTEDVSVGITEFFNGS